MQAGKLAEALYTSLRREIMHGELEPGARLGVRAIANRFNTSDLPVRQALWMLERDGLVVNVPFSGMSVRRYSPREVTEHYEIRAFLESQAIRLSPTSVGREQRTRINAVLADLEAALKVQDADRYGELNQEFHLQLLAECPNARLVELINSFWNGELIYRSVFHFDAKRAKKSYAEHRAIAAAYLRGNSESAAELLISHRHRVSESVVKSITTPEAAAADEATG